MKVYIFFRIDEDSDNDVIFAVMNNPNLEEFKKRFPDENDFYVEEHDLEEIEKTNTHELSCFDIIFKPDMKKSIVIKEIEIIEKDNIYSSPTLYMQYRKGILHRGINLFSINEEGARFEAVKIMKKFLEENGDED